MANRREFIVARWCGTGVNWQPGAAGSGAEDASSGQRDLYELRRYVIDHEQQRQGFDAFYRDAAIPALNRIGITPGWSLLCREGTESRLYAAATSFRGFAADQHPEATGRCEYLRKGADFLDAPADKPAFQRMESSLLLAFKNMPTLETPVNNPGRVVQLRIYESPSVKTGQKKIEMFNDAGEIAIFRRVGLHPVFFGESLGRHPDAQPDLHAGFRKCGATQGQLGEIRQRSRLEETQQDGRVLRQGDSLRHHQPDSQARGVLADLKRADTRGLLARAVSPCGEIDGDPDSDSRKLKPTEFGAGDSRLIADP